MNKILYLLLIFFINTFAASNNIPQQNEMKIENNKNNSSNTNDNNLNIVSGNLIIQQGKSETGVEKLLSNNIDKSKIKELREKEQEYIKEKNIPLKDDYIINNKTINYKEGQVIEINSLVNQPTILEFYDNMKNEISFDYLSMPSPYFTIKKDENHKNRLFIIPTQKFRTGILTLGTNVQEYPIQIKFKENTGGEDYNSFVQILVQNKKQNLNIPIEKRFKEALFSEEINLDNFKNFPEIDYEIWSIQKGEMIFAKDVMKIYYFETQSKGNYLVLLNKNFKILGYDNLLFSKYNNNYNVYLLDFNTNVFTIITKNIYKNINNEEKLRVIIRN